MNADHGAGISATSGVGMSGKCDVALYPCAIIAGGLATRMRPLTEKIPKSLLEVNGEPFAAHQLRLLRDKGVKHVVFCAGYLGEMLRDFTGDGSAYGLKIDYSFDGPKLLGTGGAIRRALPLLGERFFVMYGDSYLDCDFRAIQASFERSGAKALMTVYHNRDSFDRSNVEFRDHAIAVYDKKNRTPAMQHIDYGLGIFERSEFEQTSADQPFGLDEVFQSVLKSGTLAAFEVPERFYEIGSHEGLRELHEYLSKKSSTPSNPSTQRSSRMSFAETFLSEAKKIIDGLDTAAIEKAALLLRKVRDDGGRLFILGVGGGAGHASHAVNDFRKIAGIEAYAPTDNVSELTARTNDEGWATVFEAWFKVSKLCAKDLVLVFSVGGGNLEKNVSPNLVAALKLAKERGSKIVGIVGRDGGYVAKVGDAVVIVPTVNPDHVTPHTEAFQAVVWHLLVSHPELKAVQTKWESVK